MRHQLSAISVTLNASEKRNLIEWVRGSALQGTSSWSLHNAAKGLYEKGTGDWVFKTPQWNDWIDFRDRAVWLHGIPGAGKTVIAAHLIEAIQDICRSNKSQICSYYYCYHGHNQDESEPFLRSLVGDLLAEQSGDRVPESIWDRFQRRASLDQALLLDAIGSSLLNVGRVYVVMDAVDESQNRTHLLSLLRTIATEERFSRIQLLTTSRQYEDIKTTMSHISQPLSMSNPCVEADIRVFVAARIMAEQRFRNWPQGLRTEVQEALAIGAQGMFRWAACQLDILRRLHHQSKIREAIKTLPKTLDETYERIFSYITTTDERDLVRHALHMVCFHDILWKGQVCLPAQLLLESYSEFRDDGDMVLSDDVLCDLATLKDACGCLITFSRKSPVEEETAIIAHYTVREFLESTRGPANLTKWVKIDNNRHYSTLLRSIFRFALASSSIPLYPPDVSHHDTVSSLYISSTSNLREYCLASSVHSLDEFEELVEPTFAFRLLDPCAPHYDEMQRALQYGVAGYTPRNFLPFWCLLWAKGSKPSRATILMGVSCRGVFSPSQKIPILHGPTSMSNHPRHLEWRNTAWTD